MTKKIIWPIISFFLIMGVIFAFLNTMNWDAGNLADWARAKSTQLGISVKTCVSDFKNCGKALSVLNSKNYTTSERDFKADNITALDTQENKQTNNGNPLETIEKTKYSKTEVQNSLDKLNVIEKYDTVNYKRTEWNHWSNVQGSSCWTVREEVLYRQAEPNTIVLTDKDDNNTNDKNKACNIKSGKWVDPYSSEIMTDPTKVDVDHTSALKATSRAGGQSWDNKKKAEFANDYDHLVATSQTQNRTKGDKTPSQWMPENKSSHCQYAKIYVGILDKYKLNITQADKDVLTNALNTCSN